MSKELSLSALRVRQQSRLELALLTQDIKGGRENLHRALAGAQTKVLKGNLANLLVR